MSFQQENFLALDYYDNYKPWLILAEYCDESKVVEHAMRHFGLGYRYVDYYVREDPLGPKVLKTQRKTPKLSTCAHLVFDEFWLKLQSYILRPLENDDYSAYRPCRLRRTPTSYVFEIEETRDYRTALCSKLFGGDRYNAQLDTRLTTVSKMLRNPKVTDEVFNEMVAMLNERINGKDSDYE